MQRPKTHIFLVGPWDPQKILVFNHSTYLFSAVICKFWGSQSLYQQHLKCWGARDLIEFLHLPDLKPSLLAPLGPSVFVGWLDDCHGNTKTEIMKQLQKIPRCHGVFVEDLHQVMDCNWPKWEKELVESYHSQRLWFNSPNAPIHSRTQVLAYHDLAVTHSLPEGPWRVELPLRPSPGPAHEPTLWHPLTGNLGQYMTSYIYWDWRTIYSIYDNKDQWWSVILPNSKIKSDAGMDSFW